MTNLDPEPRSAAMSVVPHSPPRCLACQTVLYAPVSHCPACGHPQVPPPVPAWSGGPGVPQQQKSAGLAVGLSFLWLGAGNVYAGQTVLGVLLIVSEVFLWMLAVTGFGLIVAVPLWFVGITVAAITAGLAAQSANRNAATAVRY